MSLLDDIRADYPGLDLAAVDYHDDGTIRRVEFYQPTVSIEEAVNAIAERFGIVPIGADASLSGKVH